VAVALQSFLFTQLLIVEEKKATHFITEPHACAITPVFNFTDSREVLYGRYSVCVHGTVLSLNIAESVLNAKLKRLFFQ
jgi:hypothetical protein